MAPNLAVRPYGLGVRSTPRKPAPPTGTTLTRLGSDAVRHAAGAVLAARTHLRRHAVQVGLRLVQVCVSRTK